MLDISLDSFKEKTLNIFKRVISESLQIKKTEINKVLIVGDRGLNNLASPIISSMYYNATKSLGIKTDIHIQNHKFTTDYVDSVLYKKMLSLPENSVIITNSSDKLGKFSYKNLSFRKFCLKHKIRYLSSSGLKNIKNINDFINAINVDFKAQFKLGEKLKKILDSGSEINVQTKAGTDLSFSIKKRNAINNSGIYLNNGGNMPAGEVYIAPVENTANGTLVIDGSIRTWKKTFIPSKPVTIDIKEGTISKIRPSVFSKQLVDTFNWATRRVKHHQNYVKKVAEFGIGTNKNARIVGTTIIDEKSYKTAHIAFGSNSWFGGKIKTKTHFDEVFKEPIIRVDGKLIQYK